MQARHFASQRIAGRAVPFFPGARDTFEPPGFYAPHPRGVSLSIRELNIPVGCDGDAFGARECRQFCRAIIASETLLARTRDVEDFSDLQIELEDLVSLARGEPEVALRVEVERARAVERRAMDGRSVWRRASLAGARKRGNVARLHVHLA